MGKSLLSCFFDSRCSGVCIELQCPLSPVLFASACRNYNVPRLGGSNLL